MAKKKALPIAIADGAITANSSLKSITFRREAVVQFGKEVLRHFPASTFDKLWCMVLFPEAMQEKSYLTQGEADRAIPLLMAKRVCIHLI
jgi:hypothetical protein